MRENEINPFVLIAFIIIAAVAIILKSCMPLDDKDKEDIINRQAAYTLRDIEDNINSLQLVNPIEVLDKQGRKTEKYRIQSIEDISIAKNCPVDIKKDDLDNDKKYVVNKALEAKITKCLNDYLAKITISDRDLLFILTDPRFKDNLDYAPLAEQLKLFKSQELPTYAMTYDLYRLLDKAYEEKFNKELLKSTQADLKEGV